MSVELLEVHGCDYSNYEGELKELLPDWLNVTSRGDVRNRKDWEFLTMARFIERYAAGRSRILDAACGREPLVNWLATQFRTVVATDWWEPAYLDAAGIKLEEFLFFWPHPNVRPMVMDSTRLQFHEDTFDCAVSVSSIEHFGASDGRHEAALQGVREMIRVTKPGGLVAFTTEVKPDADHDEWWFSAAGLNRFLEQMVPCEILRWTFPVDGSDNKVGVYPVAVALRKL